MAQDNVIETVETRVENLLSSEIGGSWEVEASSNIRARIRGRAVGQDIARLVNHFANTSGLDIHYLQADRNAREIIIVIKKT